MIKFLWFIFLGMSLLLLEGCSGGGGDSDETGNRGRPGNALDGGGGFVVGTEFLAQHDGDGVNPFITPILADDVGLSPGAIIETCFTSCAFMGVLVKFSPSITLGTPFTIRSISYFVPATGCGGDPAVTAEFVVYEGGSDTPGVEILRIPMPDDAGGLGPAEASDDLKVFTFTPPLVITDLLLGDTDGTFFAGVEFENDTDGTFFIGGDADPTPFPDPDGPWVFTDPLDASCPPFPPPSVPPDGLVPPTVCLEPGTFGGGRGTSYLKCGAATYAPVVSATTPFPPLLDWIITLEVGP